LAPLGKNLSKQLDVASEKMEGLGDIFLRKIVTPGKPPSPPAPLVNKETNKQVQKLVDQLGLGPLTVKEVGNSFEVYKREALRQLKELENKPNKTSADRTKENQIRDALLAVWENKTNVSRGMLIDRLDALDFDNTFKPNYKTGKYDWDSSYASGSRHLGSGGFASVVASKEPPPVVVKRGEVSENEIQILKKLKGKDLSPELIAAEMDTKSGIESKEADIDFYSGRIAMSRVSGKAAEEFNTYNDRVGGTTVGDSYWALRRRLHSNGVAHNDAHIGNVLIDDSGKSRFVDFGISQDDPRAALSEAIGVYANRRFLPAGSVTKSPVDRQSGDWQGRRFDQFTEPLSKATEPSNKSNYARVIQNRTKVYQALKELGLSNDDIAEVVIHGIRRPLSSFNSGPWGKISKEEAMKLIQLVYQGVE